MINLVKMEKDGKQIEVSPLVVADHKSLGWQVVGKDPTAAEPAPEAPEKKAKGSQRSSRRSKKTESESEAPGE